MKNDPKLAQYSLTRAQAVFASVWYNMTYAYSLDSHRVRVMHAVNILEELMRLSTLPHASNEDRWMVAREEIGILESEAALRRETLNAATTGIRTLLAKSFGEKFDKGVIEKGRALLESHLREYIDLLHRYYVNEVIQGLHDAVLAPDTRPEPERFKEIRSLTGSLISCLIARGQSIEGLYQLYRQVLVPIKPQKKAYVFAQRFDLLRKLITSESRSWRACFAIDGVTDIKSFPPQIGDIVFSPEAPEEMGALAGMKKQGHRLFAYGWADAIDARTAGQGDDFPRVAVECVGNRGFFGRRALNEHAAHHLVLGASRPILCIALRAKGLGGRRPANAPDGRFPGAGGGSAAMVLLS